jgi:glycosyltransferase involved in cell wall biosynthesis
MQVDVVIPAFNAGRYIEEALLSVANQTLPPARVIVVDDGSTDDTVERVRDFAARHPQLQIECVSQKNAGPSAARNNGLRRISADFVALLDADDRWCPDKLARQAALFQAGDSEILGLVYCDYLVIDAESRPVISAHRQKAALRGHAEQALRSANLVAGSASAVLLRTSALHETGCFDEALVCAEDWDFWLRLARKWHIDSVAEPLVQIRQHDLNAQKSLTRMLGGELRFAEKLYWRSELSLLHWLRLLGQMQRLRVRVSDFSPWPDGSPVPWLFAEPWICLLGCGVNLMRGLLQK